MRRVNTHRAMVLDMTAWNRRWRDDVRRQRAHCVRRPPPRSLYYLNSATFNAPLPLRLPSSSRRGLNTPHSRPWRTLQLLLAIGTRIGTCRLGIISSYSRNGRLLCSEAPLFLDRQPPTCYPLFFVSCRAACPISSLGIWKAMYSGDTQSSANQLRRADEQSTQSPRATKFIGRRRYLGLGEFFYHSCV